MKLSESLFLLLVSSAVTDAFSPAFTVTTKSHSQTVTSIFAETQRTAEEEVFFAKTKELCAERNFPFEKVKNARDLASVRNSPVQPCRLLRTGRISDASEKDLEELHGKLGVRTLVDLRSPTELKDDLTLDRDEVFGEYTNLIWDERKHGVVKELRDGEPRMKAKSKNPFKKLKKGKEDHGNDASSNPDDDSKILSSAADLAAITTEVDDGELLVEQCPEDVQFLDDDHDGESESSHDGKQKRFVKTYAPGAIFDDASRGSRKERHFVSIMNELKYVKGTISKVRKRDIAKILIECPGALVSKRVRGHIKKPFLDEINSGGLPMLNELVLKVGAPGIHYVLDLCKDRNRHPIAFYCTAGKDRTGIIAAIILAAAGVPEEDIIEDYSLSANVYAEMNDHQAMVGALSQRNLDAKTFLGAPPSVMEKTLKNINKNWGSIEGYLDYIGFDEDDRKQLKSALLDP
jgi:protein tyrosine/serine phosphatase